MGSIPQLSIIKGPHKEFTPQSIHRIFEENHLQYHCKSALIYNDELPSGIISRALTYQQVNEKSNQFGRFFLRESLKRSLKPNADGDYVIAVCMQPSDTLVMVLLATWKAGAAYLPIDPSFPPNRIDHILKEAKPIMVICDNDIDRELFGSTCTLTVNELYQKSHEMQTSNIPDSKMLNTVKDLAIILYTSGSTGIPKGVRLPHSIILNRLQWQWETFPYSSEESIGVFKTALTFVDSISELWGPLLNGMAILVIPKAITKDPERLVTLLDQYKIRRLVLVPTLLRNILMYLQMSGKSNVKLLHRLQIWVCSGEPLPLQLAESFYDYFQEGVHALYNFYGSTEVMGDVTFFACESKKQLSQIDRIPIGLPINNTVIYLLDQDYRPVKNGQIGEIFVAGMNLASGYVNGRDPDRFFDNPLAVEFKYSRLYRTGDYGSVQDGFIYYEGRTDSQIKIRGHRVDLSEVEKNVLSIDVVDKAVVLCYHVDQLDQALLAFVKLRDDSPLFTGLQIEAALKSKLADYMIPQVVLIDRVPLLVNGKIDRQALLKTYETTNNNEDDTVIVLDFDFSQVPKDLKHIARDLFETVGSVIGRSTRATLTLNSNFYELGGNSLNSIFTVTLLREKGYSIGISDFIRAKNLGDILYKIAKNDNIVPMEEEWTSACPHLNMKAFNLTLGDKDDVIEIIVESFYGKADLEQWLKPDILRTDYSDIINEIWEILVQKDLSFIVKDINTNRVIGTALNFDARDEPAVEVKSRLSIVFDFLETLEGPIRDTYLPKGLNVIFHSFMMGTSPDLNPQENIACMHFMEHEVLKLAKSRQFVGILTTNSSPLTQQLGSDVYKYKTLLDYQVNKYIHTDGTRPFSKAPDTQRCIVHWKEVDYSS